MIALVLMAACSNRPLPAEEATPPTSAHSTLSSELTGPPGLDAVPEESRISTGTADPRNTEYWIAWSTCGEGSQAEVADANGGRSAGWILLDDLLDDPGIGLGDAVVVSCDEAVGLLEEAGAGGDLGDALAGNLLAAQLNLYVGAESCPAIEESVIAAHVILASVGYEPAAPDRADVVPDGLGAEVTELLAAYNSGELCR